MEGLGVGVRHGAFSGCRHSHLPSLSFPHTAQSPAGEGTWTESCDRSQMEQESEMCRS